MIDTPDSDPSRVDADCPGCDGSGLVASSFEGREQEPTECPFHCEGIPWQGMVNMRDAAIRDLAADRDEWRTKALSVEQHPVVVALRGERDEARAALLAMGSPMAVTHLLAERDAARADAAAWQTSAEQGDAEEQRLEAALDAARADLARVNAEAGAMRRALVDIEAGRTSPDDGLREWARAALTTNAGKAVVDELAAARRVVEAVRLVGDADEAGGQ